METLVEMKCSMNCFNCEYDDCINDRVYSEKSRYCNRSEAQKQYQRDYAKKKRDEARSKGFCIVCRNKPATHGSKCYECYLRQKRHDRAKYSGKRQEWLRNGLCYFCGNTTKTGFKTCEKHYKIYFNNGLNVTNHPHTQKARKEYKKLYSPKKRRETEKQ